MTPTATKKTSPKAESDKRKQAWDSAEHQARELGRELSIKVATGRGLHEQRQRLIQRNPLLVNHKGEPVGANEVAVIDKHMADLGDLGDLEQQVIHAKRVAESRKQAFADHSAAHYGEIVADQRTESDTHTAELNQAVAKTLDLARRQLAHIRNAENQAVLAGRNPRSIRGLDEVAELIGRLQGLHIPTPLPEKEGEPIPRRAEPAQARALHPGAVA